MFFKGLFTIILGLVKIGEMVLDAYYLRHSVYAASWIFWSNLSLMIGPTAIIFIFLIFWGLCSTKSKRDFNSHLILSFFILTHPLGIANFFFGFYLFTLSSPKNPKKLTEAEVKQKENIRTIGFISRNCKFAECILQSIPQTALKSYNNYLISNWGLLGILTVCFSIGSAIFSMIQTCFMLDKETRQIKKQATRVDIMKSFDKSNLDQENPNYEECYDPSFVYSQINK